MKSERSTETYAERGRRLAGERRAARLAAVQALYQWEMNGAGDPHIVVREFIEHRFGRLSIEPAMAEGISLGADGRALFENVMAGAAEHAAEVDSMIAAVLTEDWTVERLDAILRAVLRCGAYELAYRPDIPAKVTISEYIAVADAFLDTKETSLVNGLLDQLARQLRSAEVEQ